MYYKFYRGFIATMSRYFFEFSTLAALFFFLTGYALCRKYSSFRHKYAFYIPCLFPVGYQLVVTVYLTVHVDFIIHSTSFALFPYVYLAAALFLAALSVYYLLLLFGWTTDFFLAAGILAVGIASRVMVGFTPVIFASGTRTSLFSDFSFIFAILVLLQCNELRTSRTARYALGGGAVLQVVKNLFLL